MLDDDDDDDYDDDDDDDDDGDDDNNDYEESMGWPYDSLNCLLLLIIKKIQPFKKLFKLL